MNIPMIPALIQAQQQLPHRLYTANAMMAIHASIIQQMKNPVIFCVDTNPGI